MSTTAFSTAVAQARDLLRWRSPLRTELWAARLAAGLEPGEVEPFLRELAADGSAESRLTLAALAAVDITDRAATGSLLDEDREPSEDQEPSEGRGSFEAGDTAAGGRVLGVEVPGTGLGLPGWVDRMGRVTCEEAWYGKADPYGEQTLAVLSFRYENGKEPHILVVGIDQPNGGLAVDAVVEEVKFLDDLGLGPAEPGVVAGRVLDAFELGDRIMGAQVADTLPAVRPLAIARALAVPGLVRQAPDGTPADFHDLPDVPGAREAFERLAEFVGERPLWWSPARVSQFLTSWLPREAILSDAAVAAMPEVVRAWSRFNGDQPAVLRQIDEDAPRLPALMADESLAGLVKRLAQQRP
ncbi:hypothetical protein DMB42_22280 [Nonomuraea sp. WAC 01424]|uniref:hypothetical protein n=1 Tax=Nonomuraea sp. WAC 01424 TaxID=2203200 RepID=UPI000F768768|nr:hypothetical protein [Nonomuraea sp. WAC 01424]RSN07392.1 hypothetical protein DMB42_22280 [Nonomuraea sp. WAC 01424]